jgi:hypothetical protein
MEFGFVSPKDASNLAAKIVHGRIPLTLGHPKTMTPPGASTSLSGARPDMEHIRLGLNAANCPVSLALQRFSPFFAHEIPKAG